MKSGSATNNSVVEMGVHAGTHVDAPDHFLDNGLCVEQLPLSTLVGPAWVVELSRVDLITGAVLKKAKIPPRARRVLFKTRNSEEWRKGARTFNKQFVGLSPDGAEYLLARGVKLVGVDYLSVAPYADGGPTHRVLLKAGVVVVEGLDLSQVLPGRYILYCLPLRLAGTEGAPARAILVGR